MVIIQFGKIIHIVIKPTRAADRGTPAYAFLDLGTDDKPAAAVLIPSEEAIFTRRKHAVAVGGID